MSGRIDPVCDCCGRPVADDPAPPTRVQVGITCTGRCRRAHDTRERLRSAKRAIGHNISDALTDARECTESVSDLQTVNTEYPLAAEPMDRWIDICADYDPSEMELVDMLGPDRPVFYGIMRSRIARTESETPGTQSLITPIEVQQ